MATNEPGAETPEERESARRRRIYRAPSGLRWGVRFERSERNEELVEGMVGPGWMASLEIVATRPRWVGVVRKDWKAVRSSAEAEMPDCMLAAVLDLYEAWMPISGFE